MIGWAQDRTLEDDLPLDALRMAFEQRQPPSGLVHHSDRGSQYASHDYTDFVKGSQLPDGQYHTQEPNRDETASRWSVRHPGKRTGRQDHTLLTVRDEF